MRSSTRPVTSIPSHNSQEIDESTVRSIVMLLSIAAFITIAAMRITDPLLPIVATDFGISIGAVGAIVTAYALPYGVFQLIYGPLGERVGKILVIKATLAASALFTAACAYAPDIDVLIGMRFLSGCAGAGIVPLSLAFIADNVPYARRQAAVGRYLTGLTLGGILGGSLGGAMGEFFGWRPVFVLFGATGFLIAIVLWIRTRQLPDPVTADGKAYWSTAWRPYLVLLRTPTSRAVMLMSLLEGCLFFGSFAFIGAFIKVTFDLSYILIGLILAGFGTGGLIYSATVRWLLATFGERGMILLGGTVVVATLLALAKISIWWWCIPVLLVAGLGFYVMHATVQNLATELAPRSRGIAVSLFAFFVFMGQGIGAAVHGAIIDRFGYSAAFLCSAIGIAVLVFWFQSWVARIHAARDH